MTGSQAPGEVVQVLADAESVARAAVERIGQAARAAIAARGRFRWALAGGSTPLGAYALLARRPEAVDWRRVDLFWGDERMVPADDPASNFGQARRVLLSRVPLPPDQVHRVRGEMDTPEAAARAYERELGRSFGTAAGETPAFDLVLLGMGADGHTASLFPGGPELAVADRLATAAAGPPAGPPRVTLTLPVLNAAAAVLFLVSGAAKRQALARVLAGPPSDQLPASRVRPAAGELTWLVDRSAAPPTLAGGASEDAR